MTILVGADARVLAPEDWRPAQEAHHARVEPWIAPRLARKARGEKHPVDDFLFDYYVFRPGQLRRWHPGYGTALAGRRHQVSSWLTDPDYVEIVTPLGDGVTTSDNRLHRHRDRLIAAQALISATATREPRWGCFGLHEWAMVYRMPAHEIRHDSWPLRLTPADIADVVDDQGLRCTHFDAFRFYSTAARPLNELRLTRADQPDVEQPGCLHATMDLYKWASMFSPFMPSDVVADTFELARDVRQVDMRSSPYDLSGLGLAPIRVECADGRREFVAAQREFHARATSIRDDLLTWLTRLLGTISPPPPSKKDTRTTTPRQDV